MIEELKKEIASVVENIDVLPKKTKKDKEKLNGYLDESLNHYNELMNSCMDEINERYNNIVNAPSEMALPRLKEEAIDYNLIRNIDPAINPFYKMELDKYIYQLTHFFQDDLEATNEVIKAIINRFNEVGIKLTHKDFNLTNYVHIYMNALLNNEENINQVFNEIYWQCPRFIIQIVINIYRIYFKNLKKIQKYYAKLIKNSITISKYVTKLNAGYEADITEMHNDRSLLVNKFLSHEISIADYSIANIDRVKEALLCDEPDYNSLLMFDETLSDYLLYLKYKFLFDDVKKLYQDKKSYKGLFQNKLKEIAKKEKELIKNSKKTLRYKDDRLNEAKLKVDALVNEINGLYLDLDELFVKDDIYNKINDQTSWLEVFRIVANNYYYIIQMLRKENENITLNEIAEDIEEMKGVLYNRYSYILYNISIGSVVIAPRIIADKYKLLGFNITEQDLNKDKIEEMLKNANILINNIDLTNLGLKYEDIDFILDVEKTVKK